MEIPMPRKRKDPKPRARKGTSFPVEPWQPLMDFLNDRLEDCWRPYLVILDMPPTMKSYLDDETLLELGVDPAGAYFRLEDENGLYVPPLGRYAGELPGKFAPLPVDSVKAYRKRVEPEITDQREILRRAMTALAEDPGKFYGTQAGRHYLDLVKKAMSSARLHSIHEDFRTGGEIFWIRFPHFGYAAAVLIERLRQNSEDWRLRKCCKCAQYYLKKTKRNLVKNESDQKWYCSDECRDKYHNEEKSEVRRLETQERKAQEQREVLEEQLAGRDPRRCVSGGRRRVECPFYQNCVEDMKAAGSHDFTCANCDYNDAPYAAELKVTLKRLYGLRPESWPPYITVPRP
jgi:hypothetical protein